MDGVKAVVFVGPSGIIDSVKADSRVDLETVAGEYAMLLRIATRTSEDTGAGNLVEHMVVSDKSVVIARSISPDHFLIAVFQEQDPIGRARYELKKAARELSR